MPLVEAFLRARLCSVPHNFTVRYYSPHLAGEETEARNTGSPA